MRILGAIVQIAVLAMFHTGHDLALGGTVALELVRDDHAGDIPAALEPLAAEGRCRVLIPSTLDYDLQDSPVLIHRPPQIVACATDREEHRIQVPGLPMLRPSATPLIGLGLAKLPAPWPDRFIRHDDATGEEELCAIAVAQTETKGQPDTVSNNFRREPVACIRIGRRSCVHVATRPHWPRVGQVGWLS